MVLTCYRCPRKIAAAGTARRLFRLAHLFGWTWIGGRQHCPACAESCRLAGAPGQGSAAA